MTTMALRLITVFSVLGLYGLMTEAKSKYCSLKLEHSLFRDHPIILMANASEFFYPYEKNIKLLSGSVDLRVACPGNSTLLVKKKDADRTAGRLECVSKSKFRFSDLKSVVIKTSIDDDDSDFQLKDLHCKGAMQSVTRPLASKKGLDRAQIGFKVATGKSNLPTGYINVEGDATDSTEFIPSIIELATGEVRGERVRWAHAKISSMIEDREPSEVDLELPYQSGVFFPDIVMEDVYNRANQRASFFKIFDDIKLVDKYLPEIGEGLHFVRGQLISPDDLFYETQRDATYVYDNVVPMWASVATGNWQFVDELVRNKTDTSIGGFDVWAGTFHQLYLDDNNSGYKSIHLIHDVQVPQFLYRYVYEASRNKGLVFITLNNPHVQQVSLREILCDKYSGCDFEFLQFGDLTAGYTYCCLLDDFRFYASQLDLPIFTDSKPLF